MSQCVVNIRNVSKKFTKSIKHSMLYGFSDIIRNMMNMNSQSHILRKHEFWALNNISIEVMKGDALGIIGPNGSGKTTLLKLINGIFWPDKGKIMVNGSVGALIQVGAGFHPMLTGRENIYINGAILGMSRKRIDTLFDSIVTFADIGDFLDTPVKFYSSGMFIRLGFAVAIHSEPDILLVDEILAVGDEGFQKKCFKKISEIRQKYTTVILVSHNMHKISTFANKVLLINNGEGHFYNSTSEGVKAYKELFEESGVDEIERICTGNKIISFRSINIKGRALKPRDSFSIGMEYESKKDIKNIGIDTVILTDNESEQYFQATNRAYNSVIDIKKGNHKLFIDIKDIQVNMAKGKIVIALWTENRGEYLFWWRIPVAFEGVDYSTGKNHLHVKYRTE